MSKTYCEGNKIYTEAEWQEFQKERRQKLLDKARYGYELWRKNKSYSSRFLETFDKAMKTKNEDDYMEELRLKERESIKVERD